jgi:stress response protein YsnF
MRGPELSEEEHELILSAEELVVDKRVVPKERIRLDKDVVTEERSVDEEIRKERIDVEGDVETGRPGR